jgi:hypothetical protein
MTPTRFSLCATCLFLAIVSQTPGEAAADIALWTVVERNDTAPGGGAFLNFGSPVLNGSGQIAFAADVASPGPSGVWRESSGVFEPLLAKGVTPTQPGGETIDWISSVLLTGNGDVVARVELSSFVDGYYFSDGTLVQAIAIEGEPAPGTDAVFDGIGQALRVSDAGEIAFFTQLALGGNVDVNNFMGIWAGGAGGLALAARQGDVAPGSGGAEWFILQGGPGRGQPRLAPDGTLAFAATTLDAPVAAPSGVWTGTPSTLAPVVFGADVQYDYAAIASNGTLAFREALLPGGQISVRAGSPGSFRTVIAVGDPAPGVPGATLQLVGGPLIPSMRVNAAGRVALHGEALDGSSTREGLWSEGSGTLELLALSGNPAPGTVGLVFIEIEGFEINDLGQTAFLVEVGESVEYPGDTALYIADPGETPQLVALVEANLRLSPGDVRQVSGLDAKLMWTGFRTRSGGGLNHAGELVFSASFYDGSAGVYVASVPEPPAWLGQTAGLALLCALHRSRARRRRN